MKNLKPYFLFCVLFIIASCASTKRSENIKKDGLSFETAIIVDSIMEEYQYVKSACPDCTKNSQALIYYKKKPYDVLTFTNAKGEVIKYHFDISNFFGKGF